MSQGIINSPELSGEENWTTQSACRGYDPGTFYPEMENPYYDNLVAEAKSICAQCQVQAECRQLSVEQVIQFGVWGGMAEEERSDRVPLLLIRRRAVTRLLNELYDKYGRIPNREEICALSSKKEYRLLSKRMVAKLFGSYTVAKDVSGLNERERADELMSSILVIASLRERLGGDVTSADLREARKTDPSIPAVETLRYKFGVHNVLRQSGSSSSFAAPRRSRQQLIDDFIRLSLDAGRLLEPRDIKKLHGQSVCANWVTYVRHFGSYTKFIEEIKSQIPGELN